MAEESIYYPPGDITQKERVIVPSLASSENIVLHMLSPYQTVLVITIQNLKGRVLMGKDFVDMGNAIVNDKGIAYIAGYLLDYLNPNTLLSNLTDNEIYKMAYGVGSELNDVLWDIDNWKEWDIDVKNIPAMIFRITDQILITLKRAKSYTKAEGSMGTQLQAITQQVQTREVIQKEKKGFTMPLLGGRKDNV